MDSLSNLQILYNNNTFIFLLFDLQECGGKQILALMQMRQILDLCRFMNKGIIKINKKQAMNPDNLISLQKLNINFYKLKQKGVVSKGVCEVYATNSTINFKSSNSVYEIPKKSNIVRLRQLNYITFLHIIDSGSVYTFSLPSRDEQVPNFQQILSQYTTIIEFNTLPQDSQIRIKLVTQCPLDGSQGQLGSNNDDKLNGIGEGIGNILGGISALFPFDKINHEASETITKVSRQSLGDANISRWERFKNKCSAINQIMTQKMTPITNKCVEFKNQVANRFETSENSVLRSVRDFSQKTEVSLNQGYQKGEEPRRASYIPPKNTQLSQTPELNGKQTGVRNSLL